MHRFQCLVCGKTTNTYRKVEPAPKYCSLNCRSADSKRAYPEQWLTVVRFKDCARCGAEYGPLAGDVSAFLKSRYCSAECESRGPLSRRAREDLLAFGPRPIPDERRKNRGGSYRRWQIAVISRDLGKCQNPACRGTSSEMHAHHIKPWRDHPELRFDVANGTTLCSDCHWDEHSTSGANGVNSGEPVPGGAGGNPEPSRDRKVVEGVTTRGRAYRRVETHCEWCGKFVSKPLSDAKGKEHLFCGYACARKHHWANHPEQMVEVQCGFCGKAFEKAANQLKVYPTSYCSKGCAQSARNRRRWGSKDDPGQPTLL